MAVSSRQSSPSSGTFKSKAEPPALGSAPHNFRLHQHFLEIVSESRMTPHTVQDTWYTTHTHFLNGVNLRELIEIMPTQYL